MYLAKEEEFEAVTDLTEMEKYFLTSKKLMKLAMVALQLQQLADAVPLITVGYSLSAVEYKVPKEMVRRIK